MNKALLALILSLCLSQTAKAQKDSVDYYLGAIKENFDQKHFDQVIVDCFKVINLDPDNLDAHTYCGISYRMINIFPSAIHYFQQAVEISPRDGRMLNNLATTYAELGYDSLALNIYDRSVEASPYNANTYNNRGALYLDRQEFRKAESDFRQSIEMNPSSPHPYVNMGNFYMDQNKYNEALPYFDMAIERAPGFANPIYCKALMIEKTGGKKKHYESLIKEAVEQYTKNIKDNRYDYDALLRRAKAYDKIGKKYLAKIDYRKALKMFDQLVNQNPDSWRMLYARGSAYYGLKEYDKAKSDFEKVLFLNPKHKGTQGKLKEIKNKNL
ncbi:tetratricopeptide (TPR) repeat protein [Dysgonomonas sp. PH5-45]|uniref:tetratricopeptide repeat protein n=1 Tax=unclassified Dysgonomonas TaxID=2630389 RepID=UPI002476B223|nr:MULTISPECIES: tetratricopeptide repeat protein [unclassified Dysgonomonas]MDH6355215.1 tetratricopeptide (TPR) repeat protein [Dysgonomonas sp. PH5-45]MDH6388162.1 tetratricopeptide (TPR) repeat protein [Dysgonomonas sp. PH5-37]